MKKGKTRFTFKITDGSVKYSELIHQYAVTDGMKLFCIKDGIYYMNDAVTGCQSLEYTIHDNELILQAWIGGYNRPMPLEGRVNILLINAYRNKLVTLINALQQAGASFVGENIVNDITLLKANPTGQVKIIPLQNGNITSFQNQQINFNSGEDKTIQSNHNSTMQELYDKESKRKNILVTIGFIFAVINVILLVLSGSSILGGLGYLLTIYAGSQGLNTPKHKMAIATLVISIISLTLFLFLAIVGILFG